MGWIMSRPRSLRSRVDFLEAGRQAARTGCPSMSASHSRSELPAGPGDRQVDLHRVPVLRLNIDAATARVSLRLLDLPGRVRPDLVFACGPVMDRLLNAVVDRTRSRLDVPKVRTLVGSKGRPHREPGEERSPRQAVVIEKPRWNLTIFKVHFGLVDAGGIHRRRTRPALRGDRTSHQAARLRPNAGQVRPDHHPAAAMVDRFTSILDCVGVDFLPDGILDQLPAPSKLAGTRIGGIDLNRTPGSCRPRRARPRGHIGRVHGHPIHRPSASDDRTDPRGPQRPPRRNG